MAKKLLFGPSLVVTILLILSLSNSFSQKGNSLILSLEASKFFIPLVISVP